MIRLFKRLRHIVGRRDGSRQAPRRPSSCTPISATSSPLRLKGYLHDVQQAGAPRHMPPPAAGPRSRQIRKPHSPVHADRGFLHGWLCDAERHPKPFTFSVIRAPSAVTRKLPRLEGPAGRSDGGGKGTSGLWRRQCGCCRTDVALTDMSPRHNNWA